MDILSLSYISKLVFFPCFWQGDWRSLFEKYFRQLFSEKNKVLWLYPPPTKYNKTSKNLHIISSNSFHWNYYSLKSFLLFSLFWQPPQWHLLSIYRAKPTDCQLVWLIRNCHSRVDCLFSPQTQQWIFFIQLMSPKLKHLAFTVGLFQASSEIDILPDDVSGYWRGSMGYFGEWMAQTKIWRTKVGRNEMQATLTDIHQELGLSS